MQRAALITLASLALFAGWTSSATSEWFKGIIYAGSGKIQLTDATGNLMSAGTFSASGAVNVGGALAVTGATTLRSTLAVSGAETVGGALAVQGALGVTGAATLRSTLSVAGSTTLSGTLSATGATFGSTVVVSDSLTCSDEFFLTDIEATGTAGTGGQGNGAITQTLVQVTTVTASNDKTLPTPIAGQCVIVGNGDSADAMDVFPTTGAGINKESANTAIVLAAGESMLCCAVSTTRWVCVIGSAT